jgi:hypothetical protein
MIHNLATRDVQDRPSRPWRPAVIAAKSANPVTVEYLADRWLGQPRARALR